MASLQVEVVALSSYEEKEELFKEQVCHNIIELSTSTCILLKCVFMHDYNWNSLFICSLSSVWKKNHLNSYSCFSFKSILKRQQCHDMMITWKKLRCHFLETFKSWWTKFYCISEPSQDSYARAWLFHIMKHAIFSIVASQYCDWLPIFCLSRLILYEHQYTCPFFL